MAVFEQKVSSRVTLDDTIPLTCIIENAFVVKDHTEYQLRVQRGSLVDNSWTVTKRYTDFVSLDTSLRPSGIELPLPPKKMFGNLDREFIAERQRGLQHYLDMLLCNHLLFSNVVVKHFLDPTSYSNHKQETALQHISLFLRSETQWEVHEPAPDIGWRFRKSFFMIKNRYDPKAAKFILSWSNFGPDKFLGNKDLQALMKLLPTFQHAHIQPVQLAVANETSSVCVRQFSEQGSLRDLICQSKPRTCYLKKYGSPKASCCGSIESIKLYGRQILSTLKYLYDKGFPYGHLHAGNILVENNQCRLLDLDNWLLGIPAYYRGYHTQFRKIRTVEATDVYNFGQLLYEMALGKPLNAATCDSFPPDCPAEIRSVLESILSTEACKNGLPSISDLLMHSLFDKVVLTAGEKSQLKVPSKLKEVLREVKLCVERRLQEEQRTIYQFERRSKAEAFHMSEDEKKKRRKSNLKRLSSQQNGDGCAAGVTTSTPDVTSPTTPTPAVPPSVPSVKPKSDKVPSAAPATTPEAPAVPNGKPALNKPPDKHATGQPSRAALLGSIAQFNKTLLRKQMPED